VSRIDIGTSGRTRTWRFRPVGHRFVNPLTRPFAKSLPSFAVLTHRGRTSGRTYRTPINVFLRGDDYYFFLTYGSDVQWVKNTLAAGSCSIETRGRVVELVEPELARSRAFLHARPIRRPSSTGSRPHSEQRRGAGAVRSLLELGRELEPARAPGAMRQ
jgi:deazaflavin-dependent oxidoreductase (nitroreductase family)